MTDLFSLDGKVAMITGASRGLGWAMARAMAEAGAHVVINGRSGDAVDARVAELTGDGLAASAAAFDVTGASAPDDVAGVAARRARSRRIRCRTSRRPECRAPPPSWGWHPSRP